MIFREQTFLNFFHTGFLAVLLKPRSLPSTVFKSAGNQRKCSSVAQIKPDIIESQQPWRDQWKIERVSLYFDFVMLRHCRAACMRGVNETFIRSLT